MVFCLGPLKAKLLNGMLLHVCVYVCALFLPHICIFVCSKSYAYMHTYLYNALSLSLLLLRFTLLVFTIHLPNHASPFCSHHQHSLPRPLSLGKLCRLTLMALRFFFNAFLLFCCFCLGYCYQLSGQLVNWLTGQVC